MDSIVSLGLEHDESSDDEQHFRLLQETCGFSATGSAFLRIFVEILAKIWWVAQKLISDKPSNRATDRSQLDLETTWLTWPQ